MNSQTSSRWIAFGGSKRIAFGHPREVATRVKAFAKAHPKVPTLVFHALSSELIELDLRGSMTSVLRKLPTEITNDLTSIAEPELTSPRGPGRPKLGVVAREVTLLPRHWDWLASQPGGASVALRKLVEHAQRLTKQSDRMREAKEAAYRFMHAMAGNEPGFEEASRALFANEPAKLRVHVAKWPLDIKAHALSLVELAAPERSDFVAECAR